MLDTKNKYNLNDQQYEAVVSTEGPLLALAGAGTGKTKTLTSRIVYILEQKLAWPRNILAVTFTNKAAKEMEHRVMSMTDCSGIWLGTFHSIAARILRKHADLCNLTSNFSIIDTDDQTKLIKSILEDLGIDHKKFNPKAIASVISKWKDKNLLPDQIKKSECENIIQEYSLSVYQIYQEKLRAANLVDFGDLLLYNNQIFLNNPDVLRSYQENFKYIMVDEYQDTNVVQYLWIRMLGGLHKNICCVGDDDQSIYSWRGAEIGNILRFNKDFPNAKIIKLEQNYRSTIPILNVAHGLISHNKNRHNKQLWSERNSESKVKIVSCWDDKEEARFIHSQILNMKEKFPSLGSFAILVRAGFQTRAFEEIFLAKNLPYQIIGGLKFYDRMEIKDALAYIRISVNFNDNLALERIINKPKRAVGDATIEMIKSYANLNKISLFSAIASMLDAKMFKPKMQQTLTIFVNNIQKWNLSYKSCKIYDVVKNIFEESGYINMLNEEKTDESRARKDNLNEMLRAIAEYSSIEEFLEHASLLVENDEKLDSSETVKMMTVHAAKGLEFPVVFLPGWEEGLFPSQKSIDEEGIKGVEEERRIAYVAITRAKAELFITYAERRWMYYEYNINAPSRFIEDIPISETERKTSSGFVQKQPVFKEEKKITKFANNLVGSKVIHKTFGDGIITSVQNDLYEIFFKTHGVKLIQKSFVEIKN